MTYQFDTEHAEKYGVDEAILIQNFAFWIAKNKANKKHNHEGRTWTYNSYKAFAELFPFWSERQIRTRIDSLIEQGVLIKGNFNKNRYDHTTWYAFEDEESFLGSSQFELTKKSNRSDKTVSSSISTDNKPYSKRDGARDKSLPEKLKQAETIKDLSDIWFTYRSKEKGKWPTLTEREMKEHEIRSWGFEKARKIIAKSMKEGWLSIEEDYIEQEKEQQQTMSYHNRL